MRIKLFIRNVFHVNDLCSTLLAYLINVSLHIPLSIAFQDCIAFKYHGCNHDEDHSGFHGVELENSKLIHILHEIFNAVSVFELFQPCIPQSHTKQLSYITRALSICSIFSLVRICNRGRELLQLLQTFNCSDCSQILQSKIVLHEACSQHHFISV